MEQEEDVVDSALFCKAVNNKKVPSIEASTARCPARASRRRRVGGC
jgi:hypothetical protein